MSKKSDNEADVAETETPVVNETDTTTENLIRNAPGPSLVHTPSTTNPMDPTAPPTSNPEAHPTAPIKQN